MDRRTSVVRDGGEGIRENIHLFDCRRYITKGDRITFKCDVKEAELFEGVAQCVDAHEQFVRIQCEHVVQTINRWHILLVNGHKVTTGGCFVNVPTLEERGIKWTG